MNNHLYSNKEFTDLKNRLNAEMLRRGGFKWLNPLSAPKIGEDRTPPMSLPITDPVRISVDDKTYTINNTSEGSIEPTRNIHYPANGENPAGSNPEFDSVKPNTSAALFTVQEMKNFIVGLSKIDDINLFYGRDEKQGTAFRDPKGIEELLEKAEKDLIHEKIPAGDYQSIYTFYLENGDLGVEYLSDTAPDLRIDGKYLYLRYSTGDESAVLARVEFDIIDGSLIVVTPDEAFCIRIDPHGHDENPDFPTYSDPIKLPVEDGFFVLPSGEYDGEEMKSFEGLGPNNFFDDYGALPGDGDYHPYNKSTTPVTHRDIIEQDNNRNTKRIQVIQGGRKSSDFGRNPRNPALGNKYKGYPVYRGTPSTCNNVCTGMCNISCDDICSESCTMTCTLRCGNACTSSCGNVCTGCSTLCYTSCKTKCENNEGYACVKSGAKTMDIEILNGVPTINTTTYTCSGCSFSCQFYPNKKTTCWDAGCMGECFTSCNSGCADSCLGSCMGNDEESSDEYKSGKGQGCSSFCTVNCVGTCKGVCEGQCTTTCWMTCKQECSDNCVYTCETTCGTGCAVSCVNGCKGGCSEDCTAGCKGESDSISCRECGSSCSGECRQTCDLSCFNGGCASICGVESGTACSSNCRMNCSATSCTSLCSDACSSQCNTCVNTCGFECGQSCTVQCGYDCDTMCRYKCSQECSNTCSMNCVKSCTEECGGCSNLCLSCVSMCIGMCAIKCENGCSLCTNNCGYWCDVSCNQQCFDNCDTFCMNTCSNSCETHASSETTHTAGPDRKPTSEGYPEPENRLEERESFTFKSMKKPED